MKRRGQEEENTEDKELMNKVFLRSLPLIHLIQNKHVTFADIGKSFLHQVNYTIMHVNYEEGRGGKMRRSGETKMVY